MLEIKTLAKDGSSGSLVADRALALTADRETIVDDGHPKAALVLVGEGGTVPGSEVTRLRLVVQDGKVRQLPKDKAPMRSEPKADTTGSTSAAGAKTESKEAGSPEGEKEKAKPADKSKKPPKTKAAK